MGHRPAVGPRALSHRKAREEAGHRDELSEDIKAFYMRVNDDGRTVAAMDVLAPGIGEIIGGSQREERPDVPDERMAECHIDREHYAWYRAICAATARCRTPASASASSAPSPTSTASPMCATLCSREHPETGGIAGSTTTQLS
jgi:hypothetical protein